MNGNSSVKIEYRYIVAAIYAVVLFLDRLDLTIVNIALPTLAAYFKVLITQTECVIILLVNHNRQECHR